jgi:hypothetical protein
MFDARNDPSDRIANALQYASFVVIDDDASSADLYAEFERQVHVLERESVEGWRAALVAFANTTSTGDPTTSHYGANASAIGSPTGALFVHSLVATNCASSTSNPNAVVVPNTSFTSSSVLALPTALLPTGNTLEFNWKKLRALSHLAAFLNGNPLLTKDLLMVEVQV